MLALYGETMLAVQTFEQSLVGLLGAWGELEADEQELECAQDAWDGLLRMPAGNLHTRLKQARRFRNAQLATEVTQAVEARNLLAHHYLRDHEQALVDHGRREDMRERLTDAAERFKAVAARIEAERLAAMHSRGLTDDHVTRADEARRLRNYDPEIDDDVPPEPFDQA